MQVKSNRCAAAFKAMATVGAAIAALIAGGASATAATDQVSKIPAASTVAEYYHGAVFHNFSPSNWNGATNCAVDSTTVVHCFDTSDQMAAYTRAQSAARAANGARVSPDSPQVSCSGWTKIWSGTSWTGRGLAFSDWGYAMNLNSYVQTPFVVKSWFSNGQRGYNSNNCDARIFTGFNATGNNILLPKNAEALSISFNADSIELYKP